MTVTQWLALAESQFERNDFKGALQSCDAALQVDPRNSQAIQLKGKISATMKVLGDTQ
jgi:cytochrome c-type biogenesis protein CcmH/NrfG